MTVRTAAAGVAAANTRGGRRLEDIRPVYVVGLFVVAEWLITLSLALTIRHTHWLYYHGGDQVWFYTTSRLLTHGLLAPTNVGYGWSVVLLPFSIFGGSNLVNALPAVLLMNVLVLMPVAMWAMYAIGERIAGRLFGYWVLLIWLLVPLIGIKYTDTGFKQRYTELALPDGYGLTSLSDFPTMVALVVAAYFCLRGLQRDGWIDAALAGAFAGIAIGIKPSSALFLGGAGLAFVACRHWRSLVSFAGGLVPFVVALAFWKWRGLGYLPLFHAEHGVRLAAGAGPGPLAALNLHKYLNLNWDQFNQNLGSLQEHFWSARVVEWIVVAGTLAVLRRGVTTALLFGGWFWAFVLIKGTGNLGNLETGALLHMLVPAIPAFVVMVAALPLLLPRVTERFKSTPLRASGTANGRIAIGIAAVLLFSVVPIALAGVTSRARSGYAMMEAGPIPLDGHILLSARESSTGVHLRWAPQHAAGAPVFYEVMRAKANACPSPPSLWLCTKVVTLSRTTAYVDVPPRGTYEYWVAVGANWLNSPLAGDLYVTSTPVTVTRR